MMGFPLEPIEKASIAELRILQLERLKRQLAHAYDNVPHYRKKFEAAGVKPKHLKELRDLALFPFTTKKDLRDTYPFGMFAVPMDRVARIHASSGTTGKPTVVGYTKNDIDMWSQVMARLQHDIKTFCGVTSHVRIADMGAIERSIGKAKRVIDKRPKS